VKCLDELRNQIKTTLKYVISQHFCAPLVTGYVLWCSLCQKMIFTFTDLECLKKDVTFSALPACEMGPSIV